MRINAKNCTHPRAQASAGTGDLNQAVKSTAGGINDRAEFNNFGGVWLGGKIGNREEKLLATFKSLQIFFGKSETHAQGRLGGNPKQSVSFGDLLALSHVTTRNNSRERRANVGFFQFKFQG